MWENSHLMMQHGVLLPLLRAVQEGHGEFNHETKGEMRTGMVHVRSVQ